jgi:hypothetical protein
MSVVEIYKKKIELKGYEKSLEVETKVASGELQVPPRSLLWDKKFNPFAQMLDTASGIMPDDIVGRGYAIAKMMKAKKYLVGKFKNTTLARVYALQAVEALVDLGVPRDKAITIVANIVGLSKSLLTGGAPARAGGGGGAPGA